MTTEFDALLGDLMTREWASLVDLGPRGANHRDRLVAGVVGTVTALRANELFTRIVELDPEMLLPYLLERTGRSQEHVLGLLVHGITAGQEAGAIRSGDPAVIARSIVLTAHGFTLSAQTMNLAYAWAFERPVRKIYYNIVITGLSVAVALTIGVVTLGTMLADNLEITTGPLGWLASLDLQLVGYGIAAMFVLAWVLSVAVWRFARIEERWSAHLSG